MPADTDRDHAESAVAFQNQLCQWAFQVRLAELDDAPVLTTASAGVMAEDPANVAKVIVAPAPPPVVFDDPQALLAEDIGEPHRITSPRHKTNP
ncbi:hypothetical protein [Nocardia brasiliensis]|uniref:hypothetical protein n=1 Tax=Nocardia brasiliensis TaxID=37326 RepID=UPI0024554E5B|nr:hypothetical protein [Nocardia brasiliensis]